jgi:hypothetical protein
MAKYYSDKSGYGNDTYEEVVAVNDKPNSKGEHKVAKMTVRHRPAEERENFNQLENPTIANRNYSDRTHGEQKVYSDTGYDYHELAGNLGWDHTYASRHAERLKEYRDNPDHPEAKQYRRYTGISYAKEIRTIRKGTSQMFTPDPASTNVAGAFSHSTMRHTVPMMASYFHQKYGSLTADADLSEHSVRMTQHAEKLGLPVSRHRENEDLDVTNNYSFDDEDMTMSSSHLKSVKKQSGWTQIPDSTMRSAKQHYKELRGIGKNTPKPLSNQFSQPQLPGMEDK